MKKYGWNDASLQKKSQLYNWLVVGFAVIALALYFIGVPSLVLSLPFVGAVVCYVLAWRVQSRDGKLKVQ